jgi:FkbM family methyltransferase
VLAPKSGSGGFIYSYGYSEPETARFVMDFLKPGMCFWDVGAHIGEYTLLAARSVGEAGRVEAFEPQSSIFEFLARNMAANGLDSVKLHTSAVTDYVGAARLAIHADPARSHLCPESSAEDSISVPATSLDDFFRCSDRTPNLIKVDVEGVERRVLAGARSLLGLAPDRAPTWIIEYDAENCAKFGYHPNELVATLTAYGYQAFWLSDLGVPRPFASHPNCFGINLVAAKRDLAA